MSQSISLTIMLFLASTVLANGLIDVAQLFAVLEKGVTLKSQGTAIKVGLVTVPFDTLCKVSLTEPEACRICILDCIFAHRATSGQCGPHPTRPGEITCLCDYAPAEPPPTVASICSSYSLNVFQSELVDEITDKRVIDVVRLRYQLVLCSDILAGCESDCINNHGSNTGECNGEGYCLCNYENS